MDVTAPGAATSAPAETSEPAIAVPECFLCGEPANFRCNSCAAAIDLHFCSKEHQKLVWSYHKLVCGELAHPFQLPPFAQAEADRAFDWLSTRRPALVQATLQDTLGRVLARQIGQPYSVQAFTSQAAKERLNALVGSDGLRQFVAFTPSEVVELVNSDAPDDAAVVNLIRSVGSQDCEEADSGSFHLDMIDGFYELYEYYMGSSKDLNLSSRWHSHFCHRLLLQDAISLHNSTPPPLAARKGFAKFAHIQLKLFTRFAQRLAQSAETEMIGRRIEERMTAVRALVDSDQAGSSS